MTKQPNTEYNPTVGKHWTDIDVDHLLARLLYDLSCELREAGCAIPARKLFLLEAMGYSINLETGMVTHELDAEVPHAQ